MQSDDHLGGTIYDKQVNRSKSGRGPWTCMIFAYGHPFSDITNEHRSWKATTSIVPLDESESLFWSHTTKTD